MPESRTTWSLLIAVVVLAMLVVIGVVPRVRRSAELVAASTAPDAGLTPVSVATPRRADGPIDLVLPSNIQAIEETAIYARTNGYVRERYVDIGDRVTAGKLLAQIDTPELDQELGQARAALAQTRSGLAQAQASLTQARATLQQSRASLEQSKANEGFAGATAERFIALERKELVAHQDADEKRNALAAARATTAASEANVEAMQANLGALEATVGAARANVTANEANVQRLMALQSFQKLEAPFAGIITARPSGAFCSPPSPRPRDIGNMPMTMASAVMSTGRSRVAPAASAALRESWPSSIWSFANVTMRMLFAVATPTLMMAPMSAGTLNVVWVTKSIQTMPQNPAGSAVMMMNGSSHDWKFTTIRR